jgi:hypothetical protein
MTDLLAGNKTGADKYDDLLNNPEKVLPRLDMRLLAQNLQNCLNETRGYSLSGNEGASSAQIEALSTITVDNIASYIKSLSQLIQTYVANDSYLNVNASSTANSIILEARKISDVNSPDSNNYSVATSLPFSFRDNLKFCFRAKDTNTAATQVQITGLTGLSGAVDIVDEQGNNLSGGEIIANKFYELICTGTAGTKKVILKTPSIIEASTTVKGASYLPQPITIANGTDTEHDLNFGAGNFQFNDGSGQATLSAITKRFDATWAAGNNNGGLDTGSLGDNTPYYIYAIYNPTTLVSDIIGTVSAPVGVNKTYGGSAMPSGFTKHKYIGAFRTDGSANIRNGTYKVSESDYEFIYNDPIVELSTSSPSTSRTGLPVSVPVNSSIRINAKLLDDDVTGNGLIIFDANRADAAPNRSNSTLFSNNNLISEVQDYFTVDGSSLLYYRAGDGAVQFFEILNLGWKENL